MVSPSFLCSVLMDAVFFLSVCILTCACGADDTVVNVRAAVDCDLQTMVGVMMLR